ncbi:hypothetical protein [Pedobacter sp. MC2016-24]|uniref:hypothetical protein n=1 Tax=Pedobacter sp. MC2016-24 TaxID=2780090 RepID=UPI0018821906|nr:hypothetical protein [Pedobacter sp. MC2016-24]MBE9601915.1 hypothetical protein [Pedobacter sp. MC2016-24]
MKKEPQSQNGIQDAGDALWYIMDTDAWLELQTIASKPALVGRSYYKTYFTCFISDEIAKKIVSGEALTLI